MSTERFIHLHPMRHVVFYLDCVDLPRDLTATTQKMIRITGCCWLTANDVINIHFLETKNVSVFAIDETTHLLAGDKTAADELILC